MKPGDPLLYLSRADLDGLEVGTADVVAAIQGLLKGRQAGSVWNTPKSAIAPGDGRYFMNTLSVADEPPYGAVKALGLSTGNQAQGLDTIGALVVLHDSVTGWPIAVMEGNWVTAIRTAGLSATAATSLARKDSASIAFIGCGVQARSHLDAFADLFPLKEVRAFGRGAANRDRLLGIAEKKGLSPVASESAQAAIEGADLVVTSVPAHGGLVPFLDARWLKPGAFAAITDLAEPWIDETFSAIDRIVVDDLEQERALPEPLVDPDLVAGDITQLVAGEIPGRSDPDETTAFIFRGLALGDLALAYLAYEAALKAGVGTKLER
jgi:ornithine cyclodeaminase/alanine dehydrogenase